MSNNKSICLFIFRRDLRNVDNNGLIHAYRDYDHVIPCFIYDKRQIGDKNKYKSNKAIEFMRKCVNDLDKNLPNFQIYTSTKAEDQVNALLKKNKNIKAVYLNKDYTQFSLTRDKAIMNVCAKHNVLFKPFDDQLLIRSMDRILTGSKKPYKVFTPFYNKAKSKTIDKPYLNGRKIAGNTLNEPRKEALKILKSFDYKYYKADRNYPVIDTSKLSRYLKFGVISVREAYKYSSKSNTFRQQLFWKDFWTYINFWYPDYKGNGDRPRKWNINKRWLDAWKFGKTGFPIVDAGMRQMLETGWMHNRVRMIVASFLSKDLLIDWREGEKWFSNRLVDIDMAVNRGNWMSTVGVGHSSLPYFRVFNPWTSTEKYDADCEYIKEWVPELRKVPPKDILKWHKCFGEYDVYYEPIVDHDVQRQKYLKSVKK